MIELIKFNEQRCRYNHSETNLPTGFSANERPSSSSSSSSSHRNGRQFYHGHHRSINWIESRARSAPLRFVRQTWPLIGDRNAAPAATASSAVTTATAAAKRLMYRLPLVIKRSKKPTNRCAALIARCPFQSNWWRTGCVALLMCE